MTSPEPAAGAEQESSSGNLGTSVEEMLAQLHLQGDDTQVSRDSDSIICWVCTLSISSVQELALRTVNNMAKVLQKLLADGSKLQQPETIQLSLEPGIRSRSEQVSSYNP